MERDAEGTVTAVRTRLVTEHDVGATATEAGQTDGPASEGCTERVLELPVRDSRDRSVALGCMRSLGLHDVAGLTVPTNPLLTTNPVDSVTGTLAFAEAVSARSVVRARSSRRRSSPPAPAPGTARSGRTGTPVPEDGRA